MRLSTPLAAALAVVLGIGLGVGANALMTVTAPGSPFGALTHFLTGTWGWAVMAVAVSWLLTRSDAPTGVHLWLRGWLVAWLFLAATTIAWYGSAGTLSAMEIPQIAAVCAPIGAAIGFVGAFFSSGSRVGTAARVCLAAGLAVVLLADPPRSWDPSGTLDWWVRLAVSAALALTAHLATRRIA